MLCLALQHHAASAVLAGIIASLLSAQIAFAAATDYYAPAAIQQYATTVAIAYNLPRDEFLATINCESGFDASAIGKLGERGVAQIYPKAHPDIEQWEMDDPYWSILWMAEQWVIGNERIWTCYRQLYGPNVAYTSSPMLVAK